MKIKKFFMAMVAVALAGSLSACNMSLGIGNYSFKKVHVDTHHFSGCLEVDKWHDNESGIEVKTKEYGNIFLSEGTYTLIENDCPFCQN